MPSENIILTINAGSSSIKLAGFTVAKPIHDNSIQGLHRLFQAEISGIGHDAKFSTTQYNEAGQEESDNYIFPSDNPCLEHEAALSVLLDWVEQEFTLISVVAVGHRIVHGGLLYSAPVLLTDDVIRELEKLIPLAPLHQAYNLAAIERCRDRKPGITQVACFDTAFHRNQPAVARHLPVAREFKNMGVMSYGFHGLSYEYIAKSLPAYAGELANGKIIVAHLGHGVSMCALHHRKSVATTMTFSPLGGLPMATRCGDIDPAIVFYLVQEQGMTLEAIADLLQKQSGLLGVSGISADMRELLASDDPQAAVAIELFVYRINRELGSLTAALGGLDGLIFTAGIGEHSPVLRQLICNKAKWLGVNLDAVANQANDSKISHEDSEVGVWVIPTSEEHMIAEHTAHILGLCAKQEA